MSMVLVFAGLGEVFLWVMMTGERVKLMDPGRWGRRMGIRMLFLRGGALLGWLLVLVVVVVGLV